MAQRLWRALIKERTPFFENSSSKQGPTAPNETKKPKDNSLLGCLGWCVIPVIAVSYFGAQHGWDKHSYPVSIPHFSGPSDDDVIRALSGIGVSEVVDRWDKVESDGRDDVRRGTTLYPLRVRRGGETMDF
jgi:hypothetical protein